MPPGTVLLSPEAERDLVEIYDFIANAASPEKALNFTTKIVNYCETLALFPKHGRRHDDIRRGLRTVSYRRGVLMAYHHEGIALVIDRILYGGRDLRKALDSVDE